MSTIARAVTTVGSLYALMRQRLRLNVKAPLLPQEISATSAPDRAMVVSTLTPIAGFPVDHGIVANEAAMLALHTFDSTTLLTEPTFVAPGDSCLRADDPGWRWHCVSGHGQSLSDWERRPLGGALAAKQDSSAALTILAGVASTATGRAVLGLTTPTADKMLVAHADGSVTTEDVPSGGTGDDFTPAALASLAAWYRADSGVLNAAGAAAAVGDSVATWQDQSGGGWHLVQSTAAARPVLTASAFGSHAALLFDGSDDYLINTSGPTVALANCTVVAHVRSLRDAPSNRFVVLGPVGASGQDYNSATRAMLGQASGANYIYGYLNSAVCTLTGARPAPTGTYIVRTRNSVLHLSDSDVLWAAPATAVSLGNAVGVLLAAYYNAGAIDPTLGLNGYIAEVCIYSRALSSYEVGRLCSYLAARWS